MTVETDAQPKHLELWPESWSDEGTTANFKCPVYPCEYGIEISGLDGQHPVRLLVGADPVPNPYPAGAIREELQNAAALMFLHADMRHRARDWIAAVRHEEDLYEAAAATQNQENDRAWAAVRSAQQGLQEARDELRDLQLALSERQGVEARQTAAQGCSCTTTTTPEEETP